MKEKEKNLNLRERVSAKGSGMEWNWKEYIKKLNNKKNMEHIHKDDIHKDGVKLFIRAQIW